MLDGQVMPELRAQWKVLVGRCRECRAVVMREDARCKQCHAVQDRRPAGQPQATAHAAAFAYKRC